MLKIYDEPLSPNEGVRLTCMMNRYRHVKGHVLVNQYRQMRAHVQDM